MGANITTKRYFEFLSVKNKALSLYKSNDVKLQRDFMAIRHSDKFLPAYYTAQREKDADLQIQLDTLVLRDLIEKKGGDNAPTT